MARGNCFGSYFSKSGNRCDFSDKVLLRPSEFASARPPANPPVRAPRVCVSLPLLCDVWEGRGKGSKAVKSEFSATSPIVLKGNCNGGRARIEGEHEDRLMS